MAKIPATFDSVFELLRGSQAPVVFPLAFLKAVAWGESRMNPTNKTGSHWGLFQVSPDVVDDFNSKLKPATPLTHEDMLTPTYNTQAFVWYAANYLRLWQVWARTGSADEQRRKRNLVIDWQNPEFVKLAVAGWNSGPYGLLRVAKWLIADGHTVTHDSVFRYAAESGLKRAALLYSERKRAWQRGVSGTYRQLQSEPATTPSPGGLPWPTIPGPTTSSATSSPAPGLPDLPDKSNGSSMWAWLALAAWLLLRD